MGECCTEKCSGCCKSNRTSICDVDIDSVVELEIHYTLTEAEKSSAHVFESIYCLTNTQRKELKITGLEGNKYDSLEIMKLQVIDCLTQTGSSTCEFYKGVDISYIRDDI